MAALRVQKKMCATCIYRPDSPLDLKKLEADISDPHMPGFFNGHRVCHHSEDAVCRGFWEKHKDHFSMGQVAQRLGFVEFVGDDTQAEDYEDESSLSYFDRYIAGDR